jgi:uncharacterized delta-60 repeat protein
MTYEQASFRRVFVGARACALVLAAVALGCSGGDGHATGGDEPGTTAPPGGGSGGAAGGEGEDPTPGEGATPTLTVAAPAKLVIGRAGPAHVLVKLTREHATGAATVRITGLGAGFASEPIVVAASDSDAVLTITAKPDAPSSPVSATVEAVMGSLSASAPIVVQAPTQSLDASFGTAGSRAVDMWLGDVLPLEDGEILAVGAASVAGSGLLAALRRFDANGADDASFGSGGTLVLPEPAGTFEMIGYALAAKGDGSAYALASVSYPSPDTPEQLAVAHVLADGTVDASFGTAGLALVDFGESIARPTGIAVQADGKVLVAGYAWEGDDWYTRRAALARFTTGGQLDATFGAGGKLVTAWGGTYGDAAGVSIVAGQTYVFGTTGGAPASSVGAIARLDAAGGLDATFGTGGIIHSTRPPVMDMAVTPTGNLLTAVQRDQMFGGYLAEVSPSGDEVTTFGDDGLLLAESPLPEAGYVSDALRVALDDGGRIYVLLGSTSHDRLEVWSFDPLGTRAASWAGTGSLIVDTPFQNPDPTKLRKTSDGRFVGLSSQWSPSAQSVLIRFFP